MRTDDGGLSRFEHDEMRDLVLAGTERIRPAGTRTLRAAGAGVALLLVGAVAGAFLTWTVREPDSPAAASAIPAPTTTLWSGWVAFAAGERRRHLPGEAGLAGSSHPRVRGRRRRSDLSCLLPRRQETCVRAGDR